MILYVFALSINLLTQVLINVCYFWLWLKSVVFCIINSKFWYQKMKWSDSELYRQIIFPTEHILVNETTKYYQNFGILKNKLSYRLSRFYFCRMQYISHESDARVERAMQRCLLRYYSVPGFKPNFACVMVIMPDQTQSNKHYLNDLLNTTFDLLTKKSPSVNIKTNIIDIFF